MADARGSTGVATPWLSPVDCDPSAISFRLPADITLVGGRMRITLASETRHEHVTIDLDFYETDAARNLLREKAT